MCCNKKNNKISNVNIPKKGNNGLLHFLTENFIGKIVFIFLSFFLMLGIPFMLFYVLFIGNKKTIQNEE